MLPPPEGLTDDDFARIEVAVMETERGRWFLQEYARRLRASETTEVLAALERLAARDPHRDGGEHLARRDAAEAAVAMVEALQKLSAFALGAIPRDEAPREAPTKITPQARPLPGGSGELDRRLSALKELDALDIESKVKLFG